MTAIRHYSYRCLKTILCSRLVVSELILITLALYSYLSFQGGYNVVQQYVSTGHMGQWTTTVTGQRSATQVPISVLFSSPYLTLEAKVEDSTKLQEYEDHVDLRIIVLTYNRTSSLRKVLESLQWMELDGHRAIVEIWIDRTLDGAVSMETIELVRDFRWNRGPVRWHVHSTHVGLYGQWINTWRPKVNWSQSERTELALYLEDDTDISPFAYRWLRACFEFYKNRTDISGFGLQDQNAKIGKGQRRGREVPHEKEDLLFLYPVPGSWGFAPHPGRWREFQDWFHTKSKDKSFKPYSSNAQLHTNWYRTFEKQHKETSMWTMWFIRFTDIHKMFAFYSNLPAYTGKEDVSLVSNRRELGLHFNPKMNKRMQFKAAQLMKTWDKSYVQFPVKVKTYNYDGSVL